MSKKPTKRSLTRALDKEVSRIVRARGICARCHKGAERVTLQCAHIFSRKNMSVRFDLENCIALCYACHFYWAHKEPILFADFVKNYLGEYRYNELKIRAGAIKKWSLEEMQDLLKNLKAIT